MDSLKIYHLNEKYIKYIRNFDSKVTYIKDTGKARPYVGIILEIDEFKYFAPFSSPDKDANGNITPEYVKKFNNNTPLYEKIENLKYGIIKINNMIPVPDSELIYFDIDLIQDTNYRNILRDQFIYCHNNRDKIMNKAKKLYKYVTISKNQHFIDLSCDFKLLEQKCKEYIHKKIDEELIEVFEVDKLVAPTINDIHNK